MILRETDITLDDLTILLDFLGQFGNLKGKTRLQKLVFLCQTEFKGGFDYEFTPAQFGPLSYKLNHAIQRAKKLGLIEETLGVTTNGNPVFSYALTHEGENFLEYSRQSKKIDDELHKAIKNTVNTYGNTSFGDLLDYVHTQYPELRS